MKRVNGGLPTGSGGGGDSLRAWHEIRSGLTNGVGRGEVARLSVVSAILRRLNATLRGRAHGDSSHGRLTRLKELRLWLRHHWLECERNRKRRWRAMQVEGIKEKSGLVERDCSLERGEVTWLFILSSLSGILFCCCDCYLSFILIFAFLLLFTFNSSSEEEEKNIYGFAAS